MVPPIGRQDSATALGASASSLWLLVQGCGMRTRDLEFGIEGLGFCEGVYLTCWGLVENSRI